MVSVEDKNLRGGLDLKALIWDGMKPVRILSPSFPSHIQLILLCIPIV